MDIGEHQPTSADLQFLEYLNLIEIQGLPQSTNLTQKQSLPSEMKPPFMFQSSPPSEDNNRHNRPMGLNQVLLSVKEEQLFSNLVKQISPFVFPYPENKGESLFQNLLTIGPCLLETKVGSRSVKGFYIGQSKHGNPHGRGKLVSHNCHIEGLFKEGKLHGLSVISSREGYMILELREGKAASGKFSQEIYGRYAKKGSFCDRFGDFEGEMINHGPSQQREGNCASVENSAKSIASPQPADVYKGKISNGKKTGFGLYTDKSGVRFIQSWQNGVLIGEEIQRRN